MIYDYSFKTGTGFYALYSPIDQENIDGFYSTDLFFLNDSITGANSTSLSLNGQTLLEQVSKKNNIGLNNLYFNSGDYFFKEDVSYQRAYFDSNINIEQLSQRDFFYSIRDNQIEAAMGSGYSPVVMEIGLNEEISKKFPSKTGSLTGMSSFDYFLNGQKIYTGVSGSYSINESSFLFNFNENITGKLFAIPKNSGLNNIIEQPDIYGVNFVEKTIFLHLNGLAINKNNWIELYTGVTLVSTGIQAKIFDRKLFEEEFTI